VAEETGVEAGAWGWPSLIWETGIMVDVSWEKTEEAARREARKRMLLEVCILYGGGGVVWVE
jgi:hypothetical protein